MPDPLERGPAHYRRGGIQPIQYIQANNLNFSEGSIVKYITRWGYACAGGIKDLRKIIHYAEFLIEQAKKDGFRDENTTVPNLLHEAPALPLHGLERCPTEEVSGMRVSDGAEGPGAETEADTRRERIEGYLRHP